MAIPKRKRDKVSEMLGFDLVKEIKKICEANKLSCQENEIDKKWKNKKRNERVRSMAVNQAGATFVSKGIKYVLDYGPNGNLRPYTIGPIKEAAKTRNPYIIGAAVVVALAGTAYCCLRKNK